VITLYSKDFTTKYGAISSLCEAFVEEERNGLFELSFIMLNTDSLFNYVKEENIVVANANDTLLNQKFRIYMTRKLMNNRVEVFARHISFDLMYDYIDSISFENQSCEYALNSLFRGSQFSRHYKGYSDIINAQNYNMSMANILEAIGGKEGSILDTFGTGAELLRDNENIYVFNKRGHDNSVSIEYKKNLTGFELEEDTTDLVTRILPYARYTPEGGEEVIVKASFVDSPLIANYSHPFVKAIDYTEKFEEGEEVTTNKLTTFAQNEYRDNKVDIPKQNFKIEFIPLSKCVGYEDLEDNISLCDTVTIKDTRYNINTQAKVIKTTYNVLKNRYESMELGEPKTSLGDIIGNNDSSKGEKGDKGDKGEPGKDGSIGDFPNSLPSTPVVTAKVYGFANIEISWTFENQVYYQYELYASKEVDFIPNTFNLIHQGQSSSYLYQAKPNETWYFKVCCVNTHGERTDFGSAYASTTKIDDLSNYVSEMAIDEALIGTLSLDRGWVGELKGNYINAKNLSVTDGNGKRTLDIDSFGNVNIMPTNFKILVDGKEEEVVSKSVFEQNKDRINLFIEKSSKGNLIFNSKMDYGTSCWNVLKWGNGYVNMLPKRRSIQFTVDYNDNTNGGVISDCIPIIGGFNYSLAFNYQFTSADMSICWIQFWSYETNDPVFDSDVSMLRFDLASNVIDGTFKEVIQAPNNAKYMRIFFTTQWSKPNATDPYAQAYIYDLRLFEGAGEVPPWCPNPQEISNSIVTVDSQGLLIRQNENGATRINKEEFYQLDNNGTKLVGVKDGGLYFYKTDGAGHYLGSFKSSKITTDGEIHGTTLYATDYAAYMDFGVAKGITEDWQSINGITPFVRMARYDIGEGNYKYGINFCTSSYIKERMTFETPPLGEYEIPNYRRLEKPHKIYGTKDDDLSMPRALAIEGDRAILFRTTGDNDSERTVMSLENGIYGEINMWGHIDCHGNELYNAKISALYDIVEASEIGLTKEKYSTVSKDVVTVDLNELNKSLYIENKKLIQENNLLKEQQTEQDEMIIENAFMIASLEIGGL